MMVFSTDSFSYRLIRRKRQKHLRIRISRNGEVIVSSSEFMPIDEIRRLMELKKGWVCRHLENFAGEQADLDPLKGLFLNGKKLVVIWKKTEKRKRPKVYFHQEEGRCLIEGPDSDRDIRLQALKAALRKKARILLSDRTIELSDKTGIYISKLYIRDQKTRWGSSSGFGNISLNWRVIMLSAELQDYLIIHELCHQLNFNHSPAFWSSVGKFCPDYRKLNRNLKKQQGIMGLFR